MADSGMLEVVSKEQYAELQKIDNALESIKKHISEANSAAKWFTMPSQYAGATNGNIQTLNKLNTVRQQSEKIIERQRLAEIRLQKQREAAFDKYERQLTKEQAKLNASQSIYNKVQAKIREVSAEYTNLATKKEIGLTLTDKEAKRYEFLQNRIQRYDKVLKAVDASMGRYQRNVGNYASGFNPLNNAINQLGREAPAFANSMQTGFMAISNNLPALFDALGGIVRQNKELQAQGKPTQSVLRQIGSALFSLQTALSVGVTLLTLYGDELINAFTGGSSVTDTFKKNVAEVNSTYTEQAVILGVVSEAINSNTTSQSDLNKALKIAEQNGISLNAIEEARKGNLELINEEITKQIDLSIKQAKAQALVRLIAEGQVEMAKKSRENAEAQSGFFRSALRGLEAMAKGTIAVNQQITSSELKAIKDLQTANDEYYKMLKELGLEALIDDEKGIKAKELQIDKLRDYEAILYQINQKRLEQEREIAKAIYEENLKYVEAREQASNTIAEYDIKLAEMRKNETIRIAKQEAADLIAEQRRRIKEDERNRVNANAVIASISQELRHKETLAELEYTNELYQINKDSEERILKLRVDYQKAFEEYREKFEGEGLRVLDREKMQEDFWRKQEEEARKQEEALKRLRKATDDYLEGFKRDAFQQFGLDAVYELTRIEENGKTVFENLIAGAESTQEKLAVVFNAITEVAQQFYNSLQQMNEAKFQREYADAERSYKIATQFYGQTEEARAELERQYEEKRREIRRAELRAAKEAAIFNATINTAQGVTAALGQANYALAIIIGALGAAQIAMIASQEIPAYKDGVRGAKGGLALVGDGGRHEIIETPSGNLFRTPATDTLVNLPAGSNVYKSDADFLRNSGVLFNSPKVDWNGGRMPSAKEIGEYVGREIAQMPTSTTVFSRGEFKTWVNKGHGRMQEFKNKVVMKGNIIK